MNRLALGLVIGSLLAPVASAREAPAPAKAVVERLKPADKPRIDIVFCIDCSNSMGPVIETAKQKVWAIVNEVAKAKPSPALRIGLVGYGQGEQPMRWLDLSDDLDEVYKHLMTFKDDSQTGQEFVGTAIHQATEKMKWSEGRRVMKVIYMVGNETARQGPPQFDYAKTAPAAIAKGIQVNAVYCGEYDYNTAPPTWREFAKLADGQYMEIAAGGGAIVMATPFDAKLDALNQRLNGTYVAFGREGRLGAENQALQDENARGLDPVVLAERAVAKASAQYRNAKWDLVDAAKDEAFDVKKLKDEELPDEMRKLKPEEREAYVRRKGAERSGIQEEIKKLANERDAFVRSEAAKQGLDGEKAFDKAVRDSIAEQAKKNGFAFE